MARKIRMGMIWWKLGCFHRSCSPPWCGFGESEILTGGYNPEIHDFPGIEEGIRGMVFIDTVVKSNEAGQFG